MGRTKRGFNTKIHLAVDVHDRPVRVLVTQGATADCTEAGRLMEEIATECLIADRGYTGLKERLSQQLKMDGGAG
jgi:hypothetical protein